MRSILLLNDANIIELILSDFLLSVIGAMEYDRNLRDREPYREFISGRARLREAIPLPSAELRDMVHKYFHLKFLKEICVRPLLDEIGASALNSLLTFTASDICEYCFQHKEYLKQILDAASNIHSIDSNQMSKPGETVSVTIVGTEYRIKKGLLIIHENFYS